MHLPTPGATASVLLAALDELLILATVVDDAVVVASGEWLGLLSHPVRRSVLSALVEREEFDRGRLARYVADDGDAPPDDPERAEVVLHHNHLPKLDDGGFVDYDPRQGDVRLWKPPAEVRTLLAESDADGA